MKKLGLLLLVFGAIIGTLFIQRPIIETSLFALVGEGEIQMHPEVLNRGSGEIQVLFEAAEMEQALPVAEAFEAKLNRTDYQSIRFKLDGEASQQLFDCYQTAATGLLAPKQERLLLNGAYNTLRQQAIRKWHTSLVPLFPFEADPFFLLNNFITSRPLSMSGWQAAINGVLSTETENGVAILLSLSLPQATATNPDALIPIVTELKRIAAALQTPNVTLSLSGVPLHTVEVAGRCKQEISWLSVFSLVVILITAWFALKSFRVYPYLLYILTLSGGIGVLVTVICCHSIHLLAGVFATTLLGLTIDYAFHGLLAKDAQKVRKNLLYSWITTELSLLPLLFSGMPILVQSALFMMSGLATTFLAVSYTLKKTPQTLASSTEIGTSNGFKRLRFIPIVLFLTLVPCFAFIQFGTDLQDFHSPSEALRAAEKRFHELTFPSADPKTHGLLVIEGDSIEAVLEREEALALPAKIPHVSNFLPSLAKRQALYPHLKALYETEGAALIESLGIDTLPTLTPPRAWTTENVPALLLDNFFIQCSDGRFLTVIPNVPAPEALPEGVFHYNPQRVMQQTIDRLSHLTRCLLFTVGLILIGILCIVFRKKAILIALPSLLAIGIVFVCFGTRGQTLNLFHLLACFMLLGMSLDYTIFFASGERHAWKPITCSFITSLAGFGALAFVSFMVVRSIGQVFAVGLTASYTAAWLLFWGKSAPNNEAKPKTEVAASVIGLQIVLWIYRLLGKWAMDLSGAVVANTLWFTSAKIRRFTHSRKRLTLFVQSMVDKFVVMSCGRGQPRVEFAEDADTQAFVSDVRQRKGVFLLTSHFGAVEILPAADQEAVPLHAFMHIEQTAIFNRFYFDHFKRPTVHIHPVSSFGMGELFEAGDYLDQGDCILMAADRAFGMPQSVTFMGKPATFPKGVYRFAKLLEHPIYFVVCYRIRRNHYRVEARPLSAEQDLLTQFIAALEPLVQAHPEQWYNWELL